MHLHLSRFFAALFFLLSMEGWGDLRRRVI